MLCRVSRRNRVTIPKPVMDRLKLTPGDVLRFNVNGSTVTLERTARPGDFGLVAFDEWQSSEDEQLYREL